MNEYLNKISSYHLFNYLFSGVLFVVLADQLTTHSFLQKDVVTGFFLYYFIGLAISRIGSLVVEPILKKMSFIKFQNYSAYIKASRKDPKLEVLSEVNNMYRSLVAVCISIIGLKIYDLLRLKWNLVGNVEVCFLLLFLMFVFLWAYQKQTKHITERINSNNDEHN